ncbi:MAG TPA: hypothetical protein VGD58_18845 [Herpetosiphonaceae bacterium]
MSVTLEQDGLYILAHALEGSSYLILQAVKTADGWNLVENHATPFGSEQFKTRSQFPADQMVRFAVDPSGALVADGGGGTAQQTNFTLANLSLIGYLRNGTFVPTEEGL